MVIELIAAYFTNTMSFTKKQIESYLSEVTDPEIPVLSIMDMGIVRDIVFHENETEVFITPTYSGCPAMDAIAFDIKMKLIEKGIAPVKVTYVLHPAWTTDWMSAAGREKLNAYGIAPPVTNDSQQRINKMLFEEETGVICPRCHSSHTRLLSQFGSTACKALYQCEDCKEPFDYFKCH